MVRVYVEMKRGRRGEFPQVAQLVVTASALPVIAQIDIEYAGRAHESPGRKTMWNGSRASRSTSAMGAPRVFVFLGDGFALTIVIGPTIPLTITYVD